MRSKSGLSSQHQAIRRPDPCQAFASVDIVTPDVESYLADLSKPVRAIMEAIINKMDAEGCTTYVKTIYIGFDMTGEMVAAAYGRATQVEIALALPDDHRDNRLQDASHLTWRTLPWCIELASETEVAASELLLREACERVRQGAHDVHRDNDFFTSARERRRLDRLK